MVNVNLIRSAEINYTAKVGDTFASPPVKFSVDGVPESFVGAEVRMQIRTPVKLIKELAIGSGITVTGDELEYNIPATETITYAAGQYKYDVQKKDATGIVSTIQEGIIVLIADTTKAAV